jgi:quinol monooxygenase YgiN
MRYGYIATMRTQPGRRDEVVSLLVAGADDLRAAGCHAYIVSVTHEEDLIHVTEVWESKEHHAASLQLPQVKAAIAEAMPMLAGEFTSQELRVVGGLGVPG